MKILYKVQKLSLIQSQIKGISTAAFQLKELLKNAPTYAVDQSKITTNKRYLKEVMEGYIDLKNTQELSQIQSSNQFQHFVNQLIPNSDLLSTKEDLFIFFQFLQKSHNLSDQKLFNILDQVLEMHDTNLNHLMLYAQRLSECESIYSKISQFCAFYLNKLQRDNLDFQQLTFGLRAFSNLVNSQNLQYLQNLKTIAEKNKDKIMSNLSNIDEKLLPVFLNIYQSEQNILLPLILEHLENYEPKQLLEFIISLQTIQLKNEDCWNSAEQVILEKIDQFDQKQLTKILVCYYSSQKGSQNLYYQIEQVYGHNHKKTDPQDLPIICQIFINSNNYRQKFFQLIEEQLCENIKQYKTAQLVSIAYCYSIVDLFNKNDQIFLAIQEQLKNKKLNQRDLIKILYTLANSKTDFYFADQLLSQIQNLKNLDHQEFLSVFFYLAQTNRLDESNIIQMVSTLPQMNSEDLILAGRVFQKVNLINEQIQKEYFTCVQNQKTSDQEQKNEYLTLCRSIGVKDLSPIFLALQ